MNSENMMRNVLTVLRDGLPPLTPVNAPASPRLTAASMGPVGRAASREAPPRRCHRKV